uniref:Uncharacterized protein n=1 Tax=Solanum demissum TaxID=50514 RepID=Q6L3N2_SOLDE|nr:hypothetical protein SDM1_27t00001 [Solanum demissum]ABI34345.1 hypothetical protein SDM1_44t00007 [Solanum demissum]
MAFERRGEREDQARFHQRSSWISSGVIPIKGLEPLKVRRFRVGKMKEKSQVFGEKGWGVAPASAPQKGL